MIEITIIFILTFISRYVVNFIKPFYFNSDTYFHLACATQIRDNNFRLPKRAGKLLLPGAYTYPPLFHFILTLFKNKKGREEFSKVWGPFIDSVIISISALFLFPLFGNQNEVLKYLLILCLIFHPGYVGTAVGPRAFSGTPRILAELLHLISFLLLWNFQITGNYGFYFAAIFIAGLGLLSSKFFAQIILFFSIIMAFINQSVLLFFFPIFAMLISTIISKGHYLKIFSDQIGHLTLYFKKLMHVHDAVKNRNKLFKIKTFRDIKMLTMVHNTYLQLIVKFSLSVLSIFLGYILVQKDLSMLFIYSWLISSFIVFFLTSIRSLLFLGEAERYLEYSVFPAFFIFSGFLNQVNKTSIYEVLSFYLFFLTILSLIIYIFSIKSVLFPRVPIQETNKQMNEMYKKTLTKLNTLPGKNVAIIRGRAPWEELYSLDKNIFFTDNFSIKYLSTVQYDKWFDGYPNPSKDLNNIIDQFNINYLLIKNSFIGHSHYEVSSYNLIYSDNQYSIFSTK
jgi:hypothetical protein